MGSLSLPTMFHVMLPTISAYASSQLPLSVIVRHPTVTLPPSQPDSMVEHIYETTRLGDEVMEKEGGREEGGREG